MQYYVSTSSGRKRLAAGIEKIGFVRSGIWFSDRFLNSERGFFVKVGENITIRIEGFAVGDEAIGFLLSKSASSDPTAVIYYGESSLSLTEMTVSVNTDVLTEEPRGQKYMITLKETV